MDISGTFDREVPEFFLVSAAFPWGCAITHDSRSTYGPQAPTAFANGPSCIEIQGLWIVGVLIDMREKGLRKIDADTKAEAEWKALINELINDTPRGKVDSWYNGSNVV